MERTGAPVLFLPRDNVLVLEFVGTVTACVTVNVNTVEAQFVTMEAHCGSCIVQRIFQYRFCRQRFIAFNIPIGCAEPSRHGKTERIGLERRFRRHGAVGLCAVSVHDGAAWSCYAAEHDKLIGGSIAVDRLLAQIRILGISYKTQGIGTSADDGGWTEKNRVATVFQS